MQPDSPVNGLENFHPFEPLLRHLSALVQVPMEVKNLQGDTLFKTLDVCCDKQGQEHMKCCEEHWNLSKKVEKLDKSLQHECHDRVEIVGIPLRFDLDLVGVLLAYVRPKDSHKTGALISCLEELSRTISLQLTTQLEIDTISEELSVRYEELNLVYDTGRKLGEIGDADNTFKFFVEKTMETLDPDMAMACIPSKGIFEIRAKSEAQVPGDLKDPLLRDEVLRTLLRKITFSDSCSPHHLVIEDMGRDKDLRGLFDVPTGMLAVPVKLKRDAAGFLSIFYLRGRYSFSTGDVKLISSLAEQISIAATNAELYQDLKDFLLSVIKTLVASIEAKDTYTRGHSERVSALSLMIADGLGLTSEEKEVLRWTSILHDIGKIGVPEEILTKPGRLTDEEFSVIKEHPRRGHGILMPIEELKASLPGILHHHERMDGRGYPSGLKGPEIPLQGRIIAVADTYDAMTSDRSYRSRMPEHEVLAEMIRVSGTQLDPEIVEVFMRAKKQQASRAEESLAEVYDK